MNPALNELPDLDSPVQLAPETIARFREKGHVLTRNIAATEEVASYRQCIRDAVEQEKEEARGGAYQKPLAERDSYHKSFLQMSNLWARHETVRPFACARRFAKIAAELLGVPAVRMYHDQALFKEPGGSHTPWHQDQYYWPIDTTDTITMWMPLVDCSIEMGSLVFADGSHKVGKLASVPISDESERIFRSAVIERDFSLSIREMNAGDASWHYGWTLHKAPGNVSDTMREAMTIIYVADGARVTEWQTERHPGEAAKWLPGLQPGDLIDSEINPVLYDA